MLSTVRRVPLPTLGRDCASAGRRARVTITTCGLDGGAKLAVGRGCSLRKALREPTMAAKRKYALTSINPSRIATLLDDFKTELAPIATALTEELAAQLAAVLDDGRKETLDRLSQALSDAVPEFLLRAFEQELLAGGTLASERRASLIALLLASEVPLHRAPTRQTCATTHG
jgi:hypothetical protein